MGLIPITGALFLLSTRSGLRILENMTKGISLFIFFIFLIGILVYSLRKNLLFKLEALAIGFLIVLFSIIALLPEQTIFLKEDYFFGVYIISESTPLSSRGIFWAVFFNILIFLELVGIIFLGYLRRENWLIDFGVFFIFILILVKYFSWFF